MGISWEDGGYSAHVEILLEKDNELHPISQVGPFSFVLREPHAISPGHATIITRVDGKESRHEVILGVGDPSSHEFSYA